MTTHKPLRTRPRRLAASGRAQTVSTSLDAPQFVWLTSQGCPMASVLRQLVDEAMTRQDQDGTPKDGDV
jgi:hypothetical protein